MKRTGEAKANPDDGNGRGLRHSRTARAGILLLCLPLPLWLAFLELEKRLLASGFLNRRDLGFVGGEPGTFFEYLTNVWHWDVFGGGLLLAVLAGFIAGPVLIWMGRQAEKRAPASRE